MEFGEGFPLVLVSLLVYGVPIAIVIWVVRSVKQMRTRLDQIQVTLDRIAAGLEAKR